MAYTGGAGSPRKCSFLHYDGRDRAESEGYQAFVEDVAKLREEIETLRMVSTRLIAAVEANFKEPNGQFSYWK